MRLVIPLGGLLAAVFCLSGCSGPGYIGASDADVFIGVVGMTPSILNSDVVTSGGFVADSVVVSVAARPKNRQIDISDKINMAVWMERYTVRFRRSDGRNVEGIDVPFSVSGPLSGVIDVADSGGSVGYEIHVVRLQAKLEPPLRNLWDSTAAPIVGLPPAPNGGAIVLTCYADINVYGRQMINGRVVEAQATLQVNFSDFAD